MPGLKRVMTKVGRALCGASDAGDRIISLQTAFGGGKTHTQVALWHLAKHPEVLLRSAACAELRQVLGNVIPGKPCNVAVFTNHTCDATRGHAQNHARGGAAVGTRNRRRYRRNRG